MWVLLEEDESHYAGNCGINGKSYLVVEHSVSVEGVLRRRNIRGFLVNDKSRNGRNDAAEDTEAHTHNYGGHTR